MTEKKKSSVDVWLWLLLVMQPHNSKTMRLVNACDGDATAAARLIRDGRCPLLSQNERRNAAQVHTSDVLKLRRLCEDNGIRIITLDDDEYPIPLKNIYNPPIVLFAFGGSLSALSDRVTVAAVGTRLPDPYSVRVCDEICGKLAELDTAIVSGMAVGLDAAAHRACIDHGGYTVAVLGCGLLVNYPAENEGLKNDLLKSGGTLISELLPTTTPSGGYFKFRNRIISGLAQATLITEASAISGALLTAEHAVEQGREVFCVPPHDILSRRYDGASSLLRDGAIPVFSYVDIVNAFLPQYATRFDKKTLFDIVNELTEQSEKAKPKREKPQSADVSDEPEDITPPKAVVTEELLASLQPIEAEILRLIADKPDFVDGIIEASGKSYSDVVAALTELELFGYVTREPDGTYTVGSGG